MVPTERGYYYLPITTAVHADVIKQNTEYEDLELYSFENVSAMSILMTLFLDLMLWCIVITFSLITITIFCPIYAITSLILFITKTNTIH